MRLFRIRRRITAPACPVPDCRHLVAWRHARGRAQRATEQLRKAGLNLTRLVLRVSQAEQQRDEARAAADNLERELTELQALRNQSAAWSTPQSSNEFADAAGATQRAAREQQRANRLDSLLATERLRREDAEHEVLRLRTEVEILRQNVETGAVPA